MASTIKITVSSQADADRLLMQRGIVAGKTRPIHRYQNITPDTQCPTCAKWGHITLRCPNPEQARCLLCAGPNLTKDHKCDVHRFGSKKGKTCNHTIAQCCNCDGKHFASVSACPIGQRAIETTKTGGAEWQKSERVAQQARIDIEAEYEAEAAAAEAESKPELIDPLPEVDMTVIELTTDDEDTDEQIDSIVSEHWEHVDIEVA